MDILQFNSDGDYRIIDPDATTPELRAAERNIEAFLNDRAASHWLKDALVYCLLHRDPLDANNDARVLHKLLDDYLAAHIAKWVAQ